MAVRPDYRTRVGWLIWLLIVVATAGVLAHVALVCPAQAKPIATKADISSTVRFLMRHTRPRTSAYIWSSYARRRYGRRVRYLVPRRFPGTNRYLWSPGIAFMPLPTVGGDRDTWGTKLNDYLLAGRNFNVADYGAVADSGTTENLSYIQAAIDAAPAGSRVYVPSAPSGQYYKITGELLISKPLVFCGTGKSSELRQAGNASVIRATGADVTIIDLAISGNPSGSGTTPNKCGVVLDGATNTSVYGNYFSSIRLFGILLKGGAQRCHVEDNTFATAYVANTETNAGDIMLDGGAILDNRIVLNRCLSTNKNFGIGLFVETAADSLERNVVTVNYVTGTIRNPSNTAGQGILLYMAYVGSVAVRQNTVAVNIVNATEGSGISLNSGSTNPAITNTTVETNQLYGCCTAGSGVDVDNGAITAANAPRTQISGNTIVGGGPTDGVSVAISLGTSSNDATVEGNHGSSLSGFDCGVRVRDTAANPCDRANIAINRFDGTRAGGGSMILLERGIGHLVNRNILRNGGYRGIETSANVTDATVEGNEVISSTNEAFVSAATRTRFLNNRAISCGSFRSDTGTHTEWRGNRQGTGPIQGRAVLVAGTVTVTTAEVIAGDNIALTRVVAGGTAGHLSVGTITAGTSFVINSSSATDTGTIFWEIVH